MSMNVAEFRSKIKAGGKLIINNREFTVREVVRFRFDDGSFYFKCFLSDGYVFADDLNENIFILVKEVKTLFLAPFPEKLNYRGREFKFSYTAHAEAEEIWGEEIFKKGDSERFWDFKTDDGRYLSLGFIDNSGERLDFYGNIVLGGSVAIKE